MFYQNCNSNFHFIPDKGKKLGLRKMVEYYRCRFSNFQTDLLQKLIDSALLAAQTTCTFNARLFIFGEHSHFVIR